MEKTIIKNYINHMLLSVVLVSFGLGINLSKYGFDFKNFDVDTGGSILVAAGFSLMLYNLTRHEKEFQSIIAKLK